METKHGSKKIKKTQQTIHNLLEKVQKIAADINQQNTVQLENVNDELVTNTFKNLLELRLKLDKLVGSQYGRSQDDTNEYDAMDGLGHIRESVHNMNTALNNMLQQCEGNCRRLSDLLHKYSDLCRLDKGGTGEAWVKEVVSMSHRLGYSAFAPMGYQPGFPLGVYKPPAPQEEHFRFSLLYHHPIQIAQEQQQQKKPDIKEKTEPSRESQPVTTGDNQESVSAPSVEPERQAAPSFDFDFILNADMVASSEELDESSTEGDEDED